MSVPYTSRMYHDEPISDSNHSADALDDNWMEDGQDADVSIFYRNREIIRPLIIFSSVQDDNYNVICFHIVV